MLRTALFSRGVLSALGASMFFASNALALPADDAKEGDSSAEKASAESAKDSARPADSIWNTAEDPGKSYRYVGARYRHVIVPQFLLNLFADGGALSHVPIAGLEFGTRSNRVEYIFSLSYADYSTADLMFKGSDQPDTAYEKINSDLGVIFGKVEILYEIPLDKKGHFAFLIGGGVGIGGVVGDLYRAQAYPLTPGASPSDPSQWGRCTSTGTPDGTYCANDNNHFGAYAEPSWASGGSKPLVFPWIALPQASFRYKPLKFLQARVDLGLALSSGFYFGGSIDYIL